MLSVNSNYGASVALQNLNSTNKELNQVQNRINTGYKVSSAKDNGAVFGSPKASAPASPPSPPSAKAWLALPPPSTWR